MTLELRGRAILPGDWAINGDVPDGVEESDDTGITVSQDFGLEFSVECPSGVPFATQTKEVILTKFSKTPLVSFITAVARLPDDFVTG